MTAEPFIEEKTSGTRLGTVHLVCCDPDRALCGYDVPGDGFTEDDAECVVCLDMEDRDVRCGRPFCRLRQRLRGER